MTTSSVEIRKQFSPRRRTAEECREILASNRASGSVFSDHMVTGFYSPERGWHELSVGPIGNFEFHPATAVLHFG
jgi:branched-chain amino acid aminotransferase